MSTEIILIFHLLQILSIIEIVTGELEICVCMCMDRVYIDVKIVKPCLRREIAPAINIVVFIKAWLSCSMKLHLVHLVSA